ncbi:MAG TPA: metalloregulator ArsR/SmtB family transcription factor [Ktedonobacteraceae bacterium]|nr:metalloregulator ArsR/SmtB family transcription factor [Ktedonobacteraceae bacterium]
MPPEDFAALLQFFKVLADENRLKLLGILAAREYSVEDLAALLQLKAPTISHHLARLKESGLVTMRSAGNTHFYRLDAENLRATSKGLLSSERMAELVPTHEMEGDAWERKVLRDFFEGPVLKEIPANHKKRSVVLRWLANLFEPDTRYTETQVNEIIKRHHPDTSTLRRELIGAHLLQREQSIYWRSV